MLDGHVALSEQICPWGITEERDRVPLFTPSQKSRAALLEPTRQPNRVYPERSEGADHGQATCSNRFIEGLLVVIEESGGFRDGHKSRPSCQFFKNGFHVGLILR